ncbi:MULTISPECIES: cysteine protease StiP family protein [Klebsiella/Raoultella group]|uniref:ATP-binding protein n=1 Tax=Raoultella terrigena TaxID=577 RepID=A0A7Z8Z5E5_RAOTE|nr:MULTISPECIES: cysteine protease StiP family protein [Klebsiella/Raoultella group]VED43300.1 ATP-binding protein [Raoultella terrigena]MBA4429215.1 cysteine protease StiP family protein [Klebsiella michiganensis]MCZ0886186.1 cysteine protease StiP family protein [Raoultella ornithinolytica]MDM9678436.1 cysteine protease StiP family protein [Raoultella planticola]QRY02805.1 cysteine protease StiP family protein [Raoultella planticola]
MSHITSFSGSYHPEDVQFLLKPIAMEMTPVDLKEELIQSGKMHYSDMLSQEPEPTRWHLDLFTRALDSGAARLALEVSQLARELSLRAGDEPVVLVSLVRAGVPLGVMLHQALQVMGKRSYHYGVSIIRDRGIDVAALDYIESRHGTKGIVFVDGWTGKGAITGELSRTLKDRPGYPEQPRLVVLADPCGCAWLAASDDDWLIPFGIMGAPVSGLISRSVWAEDGLHGCVVCDHLQSFECSQMLVNTVAHFREQLDGRDLPASGWDAEHNAARWKLSRDVIGGLAVRYKVDSINRIKPGIAEATRAVLRRVPDHVFVRQMADPDVALLVGLAKEKGITVTEAGEALGQYRAVTIIKKVR